MDVSDHTTPVDEEAHRGGPALQVTDETGYKVAATTVEQTLIGISSAMTQLHNDPNLRMKMGDAARARAVNALSFGSKIAGCTALYESITK